jgi:membrane protein
VKALGELAARWQASFPGRVWTRYSQARGNVLAGGIAYFAFFSVFPSLALGVTAMGLVLGDDSALQADLVKYVNDTLGGRRTELIGPKGIVTVDQLVQPSTLTTSAVLGIVVLLFTGLGWLDAMRQGIRAMFGRGAAPGNLFLVKVRDLGTLATLGVAVLASAVTGAVLSTASHAVLLWWGLDGVTGAGTLVRGVTVAALLVLDTVTFLLLFSLLSDVDVPLARLWQGAFAGAVGLLALRTFSSLLLGQVSQNTFLAAFAVVVGLLVVMNLVGRVTLLAASWSATVAAEAGHVPGLEGAPAAEPTPDTADGAAVAASRTPSYGVRAADRTTLAAGVVLGFAGAWTARAVRGAVRAVVDAVRD